ncbi:hypothetical protein ACFL6M_07045 [Candidatus Eisenbacteria bacterium]|uniref:Uncharacterized protein n=1 Tax=Eiseniibacteriota bacterium TaxID=2212470 RepID=A0ABV6YLY7_UNCEI
MPRIRIREDEPVPIQFRASDRDLICDLDLVDSSYVTRLEPTADSSELVGRFTLGELDDLLGCIAAKANHTEDRRLERQLDSLFGRVRKTMRRYDDGLWQDSAL